MHKVERIILSIYSVLLFSLFIFYFFLYERSGDYIEADSGENYIDSIIEVIIEPTIEYGLVIDSFDIREYAIKRNETLAEILSRIGLSNQTIHQLANLSKGVFSPKRLVKGKPYKVFYTNDSLSLPRYFIYEMDPVNYVVYKLYDSLQVYSGEKRVEIKKQYISGEIESSLYETMVKMGASPLLVNEIADILGWEIDFFHVQNGDVFKVLYDEYFVSGQSIGIGQVYAAYFNNEGNTSYAIYFEQDSITKGAYFDTAGESIQRTLLKYPIQFSRISSRYTGRRYHPVLKKVRAHLGTDFAAPTGTPIRVTGNGTILEAGYKGGNGNYVKVRHNATYTTGYLHMSKIAKGIRKGVKVNQGQVIGYVGSTGLASGPHLCYRFWKYGTQVDALRIDLPHAEPVKTEYMDAYMVFKDSLSKILDSLPISATMQVDSIWVN